MKCEKCGKHSQGTFIPTPDLIHEGKIVCDHCGAWRTWVKKTENENKRGKASKYKPWLDYCQICLREKSRLGLNETLHIHHLMPVSRGGNDDKENILIVCTYCHQEIHSRQTYLNDHFPKEEK